MGIFSLCEDYDDLKLEVLRSKWKKIRDTIINNPDSNAELVIELREFWAESHPVDEDTVPDIFGILLDNPYDRIHGDILEILMAFEQDDYFGTEGFRF